MAQKTFEEILSESTELKLTDKFKDKIFEFSNDVNAMGIVVNIREDGNSKFFFKDQKYTKPVTDNELLAMYLDEVVPARLADNNKSLERIRDLKSEKLKFLEYKADDITKNFYKIGNYFSGETYISFHDGSEDEKPATQTIWDGTFTPIEQTHEGLTYYSYQTTENLQNAELLADIPVISFVYDGVEYETTVVWQRDNTFIFGTITNQDIPFAFSYKNELGVRIDCMSGGEHTLEVKELGGRTIVPEFSGTMTDSTDAETTGPIVHYYNGNLFNRLPDTLDITINGTLYENVPFYVLDENTVSYGGTPSDWEGSDYPFVIDFNDNSILEVYVEQAGDYTIKIEGDLKEPTDEPEIPGGGTVVDLGGDTNL